MLSSDFKTPKNKVCLIKNILKETLFWGKLNGEGKVALIALSLPTFTGSIGKPKVTKAEGRFPATQNFFLLAQLPITTKIEAFYHSICI